MQFTAKFITSILELKLPSPKKSLYPSFIFSV